MLKVSTLVLVAVVSFSSAAAQFSSQPQRLGLQNGVLSDQVSLEGKFTPTQLIDWIRKQKISFMIKEGSTFGKDAIEIRVKNQPLRDVLEAIAYVLDAHWLEKGDIYILTGPHVFVSNGVVMTTSGRIIGSTSNAPTPADSTFKRPLSNTPSMQPSVKLFAMSLTDSQKKVLKKKGFLTLDDLSKYQLELLSNPKADGTKLDTIVDGLRVAVKMTRQSG